jgi:hypothetical protein
MSEFSPTEAALEGLRISREHPAAVLWWWAAYLLASLVQIGLSSLAPFRRLMVIYPDLKAASDTVRAAPADAAAAQHLMSLLGQAAPPLITFAAATLLMQMVLSTAVLRAVLRPAERGIGYLRLSIDEVRQLGLALLVAAGVIVYGFLVSLASELVLAVLTGLLGTVLPQAVLVFAAFALVVAAFAYPAVRLSLAPAMTLADGRISLLRAWALTRGRFWPLFGAYAIALAIAGVLWLAVTLPVDIALGLLAGRTGPTAITSFGDLATPVVLAALVVSSLLSALLGAVMTAPFASAFRQITGRVGAPAPTSARAGAGSPWS